MTNNEFEHLMAHNGFTAKEITSMKMTSLESGSPYLFILKTYRKMFFGCMLIILVLILFWVKVFIMYSAQELEAMSFSLVVCIIIMYFVGGLKMGFKSILFLRKYR